MVADVIADKEGDKVVVIIVAVEDDDLPKAIIPIQIIQVKVFLPLKQKFITMIYEKI